MFFSATSLTFIGRIARNTEILSLFLPVFCFIISCFQESILIIGLTRHTAILYFFQSAAIRLSLLFASTQVFRKSGRHCLVNRFDEVVLKFKRKSEKRTRRLDWRGGEDLSRPLETFGDSAAKWWGAAKICLLWFPNVIPLCSYHKKVHKTRSSLFREKAPTAPPSWGRDI